MSFTLTNRAESSTILLCSPSKNRHVSSSSVQSPSIKEIWAWTLTSDAIASCSIRDVLQLKENTKDHYDFFWLGRVPCRSVKLVGIVVGVIVYEKRIIYTIDDGTAVIDCNHQQPQPPKVDAKRTSSEPPVKVEPPPALKTLAKVGNFVKVVGKVRAVHSSRQINAARIETCSSPNEELVHTRTVRQLHRTSYSLSDPFVIPPQPAFATPTKNRVNVMQTPSSIRSSPSSISSSPIKPESPEQIHKQSPPKLRHPSRLHSQDITSNTFQIYVKHYMDHAPIISNIPESYPDDHDDNFTRTTADMSARPTKLSRLNYTDETPRPKRPRHQLESTPRPRIPQPVSGSSVASSSSHAQHSSLAPDIGRQGFSLSYLRRVPELSLLALRVVQAVTRRRLREERRKLKEAGMLKSKTPVSSALLPDKVGPKMKRLFQWAIIQLLNEGCIVLWDGPVRECSNASSVDTSGLWKSTVSSNSTFSGPSTLFGPTTPTMASGRSHSTLFDKTHQDIIDDEEAYLSDPSPEEEAYISLTPDFSADHVEAAIKVLSDRQSKMGKPYAGTTVQDILTFMRKDDDRWQYLGDWTVKDALDVLRKDGRVWRTGKDSWDVTV